jgi:hypothetical protein
MTRNDDIIGQLEGYLDEYEGSTPLPHEVRRAIRAQLPSINQRRAWWPSRRFPEMNNSAKLALAAAAVIVTALLGYSYLVAPNVGDSDPADPSPIPTLVTPDATPPALIGGELEAGTYRITRLEGVEASVTVPAGWASVQSYGVGKEADGPESSTAVVIWDGAGIGRVYADPCQWQDGYVEPPVGPTVDDLATALADQPQRGDAVPVDISIDGYQGKMIELTVPTDIDLAECWSGQFRSWDGRWHQGPGQVDRIYILDVDGQRVVIDAHFLPGASDAVRAEQQAIVDSIQLEER